MALYLVPNTLCAASGTGDLPGNTLQVLRTLRCFFVEDVRTARRFLARVGMPVPIDTLTFHLLNEHTGPEALAELAGPLRQGDVGVISEAGVPGVADPGSEAVRMAHQMGIRVVPLIGPSSLLLALMASGMNGQSFAFNGYLPVKPAERAAAIRALEKRSQTEGQTQIFIETPYRNMSLWQDLLKYCKPATRLCIATDLSDPVAETVATRTAAEWQRMPVNLHKRPTVFLMDAR
ncbi:MAG: SAM-dependent methyltransferase [Bacteroidales bacterium]|nr:SAM-dependent methyltransferase [Bacteroidales bacterium]